MKTFSMTLAGIIVIVLGYIARLLNLEFPVTEQDIANTITTILQILGLFLAYIGRVRQGDITWYGKRIS